MHIDISKLPEWAKIEVKKGDLISFAQHLLKQESVAKKEKSVDEILWMDDAAELLNLAKPTIYGLISKRKIPSYKKGRKVYFLRSELEAWLMAGRRKTYDELALDAERHLAEKSKNKNGLSKQNSRYENK